MKGMNFLKSILILALFFISTSLHSQIPIRFNIQAEGSDIIGVVGGELQIYNISISESWHPIFRTSNSFVTTATYYFKYDSFFNAEPYVSVGYATKGYPYSDLYYLGSYYYEPLNLKFAPALVILGGFRSKLFERSNRFSGKAGVGMTLSEHGEYFSFEVGISYALFKNYKKIWMAKELF